MAHTNDWVETTPAGSDNPRSGDDEIRQFKKDIRERIATDHYILSSDTKEAAIGQHKQVTLREAADIGTGAAGVPILGAQTVVKPELCYTDEDDTDVILTDNGEIKSRVRQVVNVMDGAVDTGTTIMPTNDTIPQITEGDEYMTLAITPKSATNKLKIEVVFNGATTYTNVDLVVALFQDATANALAAVLAQRHVTGNEVTQASFTHYMTAGTTSETTFRVRAGLGETQTLTFNGRSSARLFGGIMASSITITEIQV